MTKRLIVTWVLVFLLYLSHANAVGFLTTDLFTSDGSSSTDAKTFVNRALTMEINSQNIMVSCFDFSNPNCDESPTYTECFAANHQDFDDCKAYDSWLNGMGYTTDSTPATQLMDVSPAINTCVDARYYKNCDGSGGGNLYGVTQKQYLVFSQRKYDCDSGSPSWYTYDAEGYISGGDYDYNDEVSCPTYKKCSEDDDDSYVTTYDGTITNPCRTDDGTTGNYACNINSDCWSNNCGGNQFKYKSRCDFDGSIDVYGSQKDWDDSCGGQGYVAQDWIELYSAECTEAEMGGSGYVCDSDHDEIESSTLFSPSPCRKDIGTSCSVTTDCWNDDGGNWCNTISECTDGANGRNCGLDSDCDSGRCDSTCMAKLADGLSCDENSDCINNNCISGFCGGPTSQLCNGTIEVNTLDGNEQALSGSIIQINSQTNITDSNGQLRTSVLNAACSSDQALTVTCSNNLTQCYSGTFQMDFNGDEDVFTLNCNMCKNDEDLYISNSDIKLTKSESNTIISANVHSTGITSSNVIVRFQSIGNDGLIRLQEDKTISISASSNKSTSVTWDIGNDKYLNIYVDPDDNFDEFNFNNYVFRPVVKKIDAYISIATDDSYLDSVYQEFLESFVNSVGENDNPDFIISVGKTTDEVAQYNKITLLILKWGYNFETRRIVFQDAKLDKPYNGLVATYRPGIGIPIIFVHGNDVDGIIAGLKRLVSGSEYFFDSSTKNPSVIDNLDLTGIGVYDILHNNDNKNNYKTNTNEFKAIVKDVLFGNIFAVSIRTVKTLNTTSYQNSTILRLKHVNSDFSDSYKDAVINNPNPVVLARGLWSDLLTWDDFGKELSSDNNNARDTWLIELTGGTTQDCENCPNYEYEDLVDYYWPALVAGVQEYSGKDSVDYVGFSNGCRTALDSLKNYSSTGKNNAGYYFDYDMGDYVYSDLSANPVSSFVGVGCPGAFNGSSLVKDLFNSKGNSVIAKLNNANENHITFYELFINGFLDAITNNYIDFMSDGSSQISLNLLEKYNEWTNSDVDLQPGIELNLNKFTIIQGDDNSLIPHLGIIGHIPTSSDMAVTVNDQKSIYGNINSVD